MKTKKYVSLSVHFCTPCNKTARSETTTCITNQLSYNLNY